MAETSCAVCSVNITARTRGALQVSGPDTYPVSERAWKEFAASFELKLHDPLLICRSCKKLFEEYASLEDDLSDVRRRLMDKFNNAHFKGMGDDEGQEEEMIEEGSLDTPMSDEDSTPFMEEPLSDSVDEQDQEGKRELGNMDEDDSSSHSQQGIRKKFVKVKKLLCKICKEALDSREELQAHYERHKETDAEAYERLCHVCSYCYQRFMTKTRLKNHMMTKHRGNEIHTCPACNQAFPYKKMFLQHIRDHENQGDSDFRCIMCDKSFLLYSRLLKHCNELHRTEYACKYCPEKRETKVELMEHYKTHVTERPHLCEICGARFELVQSLRHHAKLHEKSSEVGGYACQICGIVFSTRPERKVHYMTHEAVCEVCGKQLKSVPSLVDHMRMHNKANKLACHFCGMLFSSHNALRAHVSRHQENPKFQCEVCGKIFNYQANLDSHFRSTHMEDATYKCPDPSCEKSYGSTGSLRRHIASVHQHDRKYVCNICGQSFLYSSSMIKHRRTHTGERKYPCLICGKLFSSWDNRHSHMYIHSNKKPFECKICGQQFVRRPHIISHLRTSHPEAGSVSPEEAILKHHPVKIEDMAEVTELHYASPTAVTASISKEDAEKMGMHLESPGTTVTVLPQTDSPQPQHVPLSATQTIPVSTVHAGQHELVHMIMTPEDENQLATQYILIPAS